MKVIIIRQLFFVILLFSQKIITTIDERDKYGYVIFKGIYFRNKKPSFSFAFCLQRVVFFNVVWWIVRSMKQCQTTCIFVKTEKWVMGKMTLFIETRKKPREREFIWFRYEIEREGWKEITEKQCPRYTVCTHLRTTY
jgi:hypothetical protein